MFNKKILIWTVVAISLIWFGVYSVLSNDDYTCYKYTSTKWSCKIESCWEWIGWKRTCNWKIETKYTRGKRYRCSSRGWEDREKYSSYSACTIEESDPIPPTVEWGIQ